MAQHKKAKPSGSASGIRLPQDLMKKMREFADRETRTVPGQITVALRQWIAQQEAASPQQPATQIATFQRQTPTQEHRIPVAKPRVSGGNVPANATVKIREEDARAIAESGEWEGTAPTALGRTKGTGAREEA